MFVSVPTYSRAPGGGLYPIAGLQSNLVGVESHEVKIVQRARIPDVCGVAIVVAGHLIDISGLVDIENMPVCGGVGNIGHR